MAPVGHPTTPHPSASLDAVWVPPPRAHTAGTHVRAGNAMGRTRAGLLAGAARAFAERGLRRSTMQSVAAAAGVAKATLYNHFRTKDEVARALLTAELTRLAGLVAGLPPAAALSALADEVAGHPVLRRLAETEPDVLAGLLAAGPAHWADVVSRLGLALSVDPDSAGLVGRWLVGLALQPGERAERHRQAARLAAALVPATAGG